MRSKKQRKYDKNKIIKNNHKGNLIDLSTDITLDCF